MNWTLWRPAFLFVLVLAISVVAILGFRGEVTHAPPREFRKGMWDQAKAKAQAASAVFADGRVNRPPPAGTIAGLFKLGRLTEWYHPTLKNDRFLRVSDDRFMLAVDARDPKFDVKGTSLLLREAGGRRVTLLEV